MTNELEETKKRLREKCEQLLTVLDSKYQTIEDEFEAFTACALHTSTLVQGAYYQYYVKLVKKELH